MRELTYSKALNEALIQSFERDERVIILGEDIAKFGGNFGITQGMLDRFGPLRVIDCPISEAGFVGAAVGAAMTGLRPIADIIKPVIELLARDGRLVRPKLVPADHLTERVVVVKPVGAVGLAAAGALIGVVVAVSEADHG